MDAKTIRSRRTHRTTWILTTSLVLWLSLAMPGGIQADECQPDTLPTLEEILERYIEAVGGREAIELATTRVVRGRLIDDRPYRGPVQVFALEAYSAVPNQWLCVVRYAEGTHREGFDGESGWRQTAEGVARDNGLGEAKLAWLLNPQGALRLQDYFPNMVLKGREVLDARAVYDVLGERSVSAYVVETARDSDHYDLYFDAESGLLIRIGYYWYLKDYREVDGVKLPTRVIMSRKGGSTTYVFDEVEHNVPVEVARFGAPIR